ncbi:MerR family transcriptional regulator [Streptococcus cameli]
MQIKDVEKLTGLTAKSIRFYEDRGLVLVSRNQNNSYREYSEANVQTLKKIKIFRYLGFTVSEIAELLTLDEQQLAVKLEQRLLILQDQKDVIDEQVALGRFFLKKQSESSVVDKLNEEIGFLESEDYLDAKTALKEATLQSIWELLLQTLMLLMPIVGFYHRLMEQDYASLYWLFPIALVASFALIFSWKNYLQARKNNRQLVKKKNRKEWLVWPLMILAIVLSIALFIGISSLRERFLPSDWLFYEHNHFWGYAMIFTIVVGIEYWLLNFFGIYDFPRGKKTFLLTLTSMLVSIFLFATQLTVVTESEVIHYSLTQLTGKRYAYDQVEKVHARFGSSMFKIPTNNERGTFYYDIWLDGRKISLSQPTVNDEIDRYTDTYQELEEFDQALVALGVPKTSSEKDAEKNDLDPIYTKRFLRIIRNR